MPSLKALCVDSVWQENLPRAAPSLPWTRLTVLKIADAMEPYDVLEILSHLPRLVRTTFQIYEEVGIETYPPITMRHLTFLSLSHSYSFNMASFLDSLTLPSLKEFYITNDGYITDTLGTWFHQPFTNLITRSHCNIRHFVLKPNRWRRVSLGEDSMEPLLRALPVVQTLKLPAVVPSSTFMEIRKNGLLSQLKSVKWMLDAAGVEGFIDWLLSFKAGGNHKLKMAKASCHVGRRFMAVEKRFHARQAEIVCAGIESKLSRAGQNLHGSCNCDDPDTDGSEGDEGNRYCPWL